MSEKKGIAHERVRLMQRITKRGLSDSTDDMITQLMRNSAPGAAEAQAEQINAIIDSSATEEEIVEKLKAL